MLTNNPVVAMIACTNLEVARAFYGGTLGLSEADMPESPNPAALYECGGGTNLFVYERSTPPVADHTVAGWIVADVDATADMLIERGVTLKTFPDMEGVEWDARGVADMQGQKSAWFTDPEGNILAIAAMPG